MTKQEESVLIDLPESAISEMIEAGVHYGHKKFKWNPKMASFIFCEKNDVHMLDLRKTRLLFNEALNFIYKVVYEDRGRVLFVGTKTQAAPIIEAEAKRCGQYYVHKRWLGGMLTNRKTIAGSVKTLEQYEEILHNAQNDELSTLTKKESIKIDKRRARLEASLGGIRDMAGLPSVVVVVDTNKEHLAIKDAKKLRIPVIAMVDTNSDPDDIDYLIPSNDDGAKSISYVVSHIADVILKALENDLARSGVDLSAVIGKDSESQFEKEKGDDKPNRPNNRDRRKRASNSSQS